MHDEYQQLILEKRSRLIRLGFTVPEAAGLSENQLNAVLRLIEEYERKLDHDRNLNLAENNLKAEWFRKNDNELIAKLRSAIQESLSPKSTFWQKVAYLANFVCWGTLISLVLRILLQC